MAAVTSASATRLLVLLAVAVLAVLAKRPQVVEKLMPSEPLWLAVLHDIRDSVLFTGKFAPLYFVSMCGYCLACARTLYEKDPNTKWFYAIPLLCLTSFGGGILVPITLGKPMALHSNESLVPIMCLAYFAVHYIAVVRALISSPIGRAITNATFEITRYHVLAGCAALAAKSLPPPSYYSVPVVGPLIAGLIGGCGGGFMPLSSGLAPIEKTAPWRVQSSAVVSLWLQLSIRDPNVSEWLAGYYPALADPAWAQFVAILFFACVPMLQASGHDIFGANPLAPAKPTATSAKKKS